MNNTQTRCTCHPEVSSLSELCPSCIHEYEQWLCEVEEQARAEARLMSSAAIVEAAAELFGNGTPEEFTAPVLIGKMRRLNAAVWSAA